MELKLKRRYKGSNYTIGSLSINGKYFCDTLEDVDRDITINTPLEVIKAKKVYGKTAIPSGKYNVTLNVISNKYGSNSFYKTYSNGGKVPRLLNVPGFDGILVHCGNTEKDSLGCILIGENKIKGQVINSRETFKKLYPLLSNAKEGITIEIV